MKKTGAQILIDTLLYEGVDVAFGIPGGVVIPIFDVLYDAPMKFILCAHEQGAVHAADGYARASGKVGVCIATSGPGATNLVTGIATAYMDSSPIVAITGQVKTNLIGNDAFQEADTTGITRPVTKHNYLVKDVRDLARTVREAFYIASTGRPGPVVVDVPLDVSLAECDGAIPDKLALAGYKPKYEGNPRQIRRAAAAINESRQPVLYAGGGVITSAASEELRELARKIEIPVTTTLLGLGCFPEDEPLSLGMLGMHGTAYANYAVQSSDLIIAVGARFDDRVTGDVKTFAPNAKIIHIDIDPASISKNIRVDIPVVGDAKCILAELNKFVQHVDRKAWLDRVNKWKESHPLCYESDGLKPQYVVEQIYEVTRGDAIICTEVGQNQMWAAQFYTYSKPRSFISSGGLGTMGFGFPASIGAQIANPDSVVFDIAGDGSFQMNVQELSTAVKCGIPVKVAILNNGYLGMVRQWQELFFNRRYSCTRLEGAPDFVKLAEAYGAVGFLVDKPEDVRPTLEKALEIDKTVIIDFRVCQEENVYPMVPAGKAIDEMIGGLA